VESEDDESFEIRIIDHAFPLGIQKTVSRATIKIIDNDSKYDQNYINAQYFVNNI